MHSTDVADQTARIAGPSARQHDQDRRPPGSHEGSHMSSQQGTAAPRRTLWGRLSANSVVLTLVLAVGAALVGLHVHGYRQLSWYDEANHVDYVYYLLDGEVPVSGDEWLPSTAQSVVCRSIDGPVSFPPCGPAPDRGLLPNYGFTTEFIQTPLYYVLPAVGVWASDNLSPFSTDQVSAMRMTNYAWLVAGVLALWWLLGSTGVHRWTRAGLLLCLLASPPLLLTFSTVTNDATALAVGATVTLSALMWSAGRVRTWQLLTVVIVALLLKATSLAIVLVACAFVLIRSVQRSARAHGAWRDALARRNLVLIGSAAAATVLTAFGWSALQAALATKDQMLIPQNYLMLQERFDPSWLPAATMSVVQPLAPQWMQNVLAGTVGTTAGYVASVGLLVLAVVGAARTRPGSELRALAIATGTAALCFGPLMVLSNYTSMGIHFQIPARYGLTLVAPMVVLAAVAVQGRWARTAVVSVGAAMCTAVAVHLLLV